jgi:hypothetical protein
MCSALSKASHKHKTSPEKLVSDKRSSILQKFVNYGHRNFYNIDPRSEVSTLDVAVRLHLSLKMT